MIKSIDFHNFKLLIDLNKVSRVKLEKLENDKTKVTIIYTNINDYDSYELSNSDARILYNNLVNNWK